MPHCGDKIIQHTLHSSLHNSVKLGRSFFGEGALIQVLGGLGIMGYAARETVEQNRIVTTRPADHLTLVKTDSDIDESRIFRRIQLMGWGFVTGLILSIGFALARSMV